MRSAITDASTNQSSMISSWQAISPGRRSASLKSVIVPARTKPMMNTRAVKITLRSELNSRNPSKPNW